MAGHNQKCECGMSLKYTTKKKLGQKRWSRCSRCGLISNKRLVGPKRKGTKHV